VVSKQNSNHIASLHQNVSQPFPILFALPLHKDYLATRYQSVNQISDSKNGILWKSTLSLIVVCFLDKHIHAIHCEVPQLFPTIRSNSTSPNDRLRIIVALSFPANFDQNTMKYVKRFSIRSEYRLFLLGSK
jgi:hypothetical protein